MRRLDHRLDVAHDERAPRHAAQVDRLQVGEQPVVALDRQDGLARRDLVALVQGADLELAPAVLPPAVGMAPGALLEDGDRLVDAAEDRAACFWKTCMSTRGRWPSSSSRSRVRLKY